jgi:phosphopantetheine--protein transferase-like protein
MIMGIGIDTVDVARFATWHSLSPPCLTRVFCLEEIEYCKECPFLSAQRFAVRFAAREAFYKALTSTLGLSLPLLAVCRALAVHKDHNGAPFLKIEWPLIAQLIANKPSKESSTLLQEVLANQKILRSHLSLTHTATQATAIVILERFLSSHYSIEKVI